MGWFAIVKKFTNIAMFVWKFGIQNLVWTEPSRADSQIDRPPLFVFPCQHNFVHFLKVLTLQNLGPKGPPKSHKITSCFFHLF